MAKNPGKVVSRFSFSSILKKAWYSSLTMENIQSGFETTGIYPMDRRKLIPPEYQEDSFAEFSDDAKHICPCSHHQGSELQVPVTSGDRLLRY